MNAGAIETPRLIYGDVMHKNRADQLESEKRHIAHFLKMAGLQAEVIHGDRPDFVLVVEGRRIGLEHRELTEEALASTSDNLTWLEEQLRAELVNRGADRDLHVAIAVNPEAPVFRRRRPLGGLARKVAALAMVRAPEVRRGDGVQILPPELAQLDIVGPDFVFLDRTRGELDGPLSTVQRTFCVPGEAAVVDAVRQKERRLSAYSSDASLAEVWLLLATGEGYEQATGLALLDGIRVPSKFARVYLMNLRTGVLQRVDAGTG